MDDDTLIVVISYSGNTRETLRMFELARSTGGEIVAISSGGQLLNLCRDSGISFIKVPPDVQPRAALGHLLGAASSIIEAADIYPVATELGVIAPKLETLVKDLQPNVKEENNIAKSVAQRLVSSLPFIYASRSIRAAAERWADADQREC